MEKLTENMIRFEERNKMIIQDFEPKHIEEAMGIALSAYNYERAFTRDLPLISSIPILKQLSENGLGVAAFEGGKMVGFLCSVEPFENAFRSTDVRGVFSPMSANGAVMENHGKIYAALYQAAAKKWVKAGAMSHAICLYEHDEEAAQQLFRYGFGMRCVDAIRPMETIDCTLCSGYEFLELSREDYAYVYPLNLGLNEHYCTSPFFGKEIRNATLQRRSAENYALMWKCRTKVKHLLHPEMITVILRGHIVYRNTGAGVYTKNC